MIWWFFSWVGCRPATAIPWRTEKSADGERFVIEDKVGGAVVIIKTWKASGARRTWPVAICAWPWQAKPLMKICSAIALGIDPMDVAMVKDGAMEIRYGWCVPVP